MKKKIKNNLMFGIYAAVIAAAGGFGVNVLPVMAAESAGEEMVVNDVAADVGVGADAAGELSENSWGGVSKSGNTTGDENLGVYDFKDNKTTGTVTVTKVWDDDKTNEDRAIPDIKISTEKPSKSALGYTVMFHGNKDAGLVFDDGSDINEVIYNNSGQIVDGLFKVPGGVVAGAVSWFTDEALTNKVDVSEDGTIQMALSGDVDLWGKAKTFEIKGFDISAENYNGFNALIPASVTSIIFTDEIKPDSADTINVDADGDGGVVSWTENDGTVMKVSTQIKGVKVQASKDSENMFNSKNKLINIDFSMLDTSSMTSMYGMFKFCRSLINLDLTQLDTSNVTDMRYMFAYCTNLKELDCSKMDAKNVTFATDMFSNCSTLSNLKLPVFSEKLIEINKKDSIYENRYSNYVYSMFDNCSNLTSLDLTPLNTANVTSMYSMFKNCSSLTSLNLTPLDTSNVTDMGGMFQSCSGLTALDLSPLDTQNVTDMSEMFKGCSGLTTLDLSSFNTQNVTTMSSMLSGCSGLTALDLSSFNTQNVTNMNHMFRGCSGLTTLDLSPFNTQNVTSMGYMFSDCSGLTALDLSPLNTQNVTNMGCMFSYCSGLTALDLSSFDTQKVTTMSSMFSNCSSLTALDLSPLDTQNVTSMNSMFRDCSGLTALDLSPLDTQNVTNIGCMFSGCSRLRTLDLSSLDTQNVKNMDSMFSWCNSLTALDLSSFNTQNVTNMQYMFYYCRSLTNITTGPNFKFVGTNYSLSGTWQNTAGETFTSGNFPSNVADTYTKIK